MTEPTDAEIWQMWMPMTRMGLADPVEFARAVLAKWGTPPAVAGEPVAWQSRMRPTWGNNTAPWTQWEPCTKGQAEDYWKTNLLHDWAFEARALYTTPQPTQAQAGAVPLTDEQIQEAILPINPHGMGYFLRIARAIERAHGIGIKKGESNGLPT